MGGHTLSADEIVKIWRKIGKKKTVATTHYEFIDSQEFGAYIAFPVVIKAAKGFGFVNIQ